ncbi:MAG: c-type cytochrome biogenesis protein CcmI [Acetobacteraceae bacterium]|nr:c-type cytochrome biogenesis protein CcmI [Acetobacteraceae bacterium]
MIWFVLLAFAALTLLPFALSLSRGASLRDRRAAALTLHRAQLVELARDRDAGRLGSAEYDAALLEIQRRLLAVDQNHEATAKPALGFPLVTLFPLLPLIAMLLYLLAGIPGMPAQPLAERKAAAALEAAAEDALLADLRRTLAGHDAGNEQARRGFVLLGNAEARQGNMAAAAAAWRIVLEASFDPAIAVLAGVAIFQAEGKLTAEAAVLFRRALAAGPPDAAWRPMVEQRLREASP